MSNQTYRHIFQPRIDEPQHAWDKTPQHAPHAKVMETLVVPESPTFRYGAGMYVYVHDHAYETNPLAARECVITDCTNQPLEIKVAPCNHPEQEFTVCADRLSAPIYV